MLVRVARYLLKHAVAGCVVVGASVVLAFLAYIGLLVWAVLTDSPFGGPFALPFMLLAALVLSLLAVLAVLWPVTTLSEFLCRHAGNWHVLAQIPVAFLLLFVEATVLGILYAINGQQPLAHGAMEGAIAGLILLIPLGAYWCSQQATSWILGACGKLWTWLVKRGKSELRVEEQAIH